MSVYPSVKVFLEVLPKFFKSQDSLDVASLESCANGKKATVSTPSLLYNWHDCDNEAVLNALQSLLFNFE